MSGFGGGCHSAEEDKKRLIKLLGEFDVILLPLPPLILMSQGNRRLSSVP